MIYLNSPEILRQKSRRTAEELFTKRTRSAYLGRERALCVVLGKYKMYVDTSDIGLSSHMMLDGYWEYWLTKFIADNVKEGDVVIDVGANLGYYSLLMADIVGTSGSVVSFEPNPAIFELLRSSIQVNGFLTQAKLHNAAVSDDADGAELAFFIPHGDPKNGTIVPAGYTNPRGRTEMVRSIGFDALNLERLDFVKIDVEGAEVSVLKSLRDLKERHNPQIVVEVNFARNYTYDDIVALVGTDDQLLHIDFDAEVKPLTRSMAAGERLQDDWLVYWPGKTNAG